MNREELLALVVQFEKENKPHITLPREVVKELLEHYQPTVTMAIDNQMYSFVAP